MIRGALLMTGAGILCKLIGMLHRIWLGNILGAGGVGRYQLAYSVYGVLLTAVSGGIPQAVAALTAGSLAKGDTLSAVQRFYAVRRWMCGLGLAGAAVLIVCGECLAGWMGIPGGGRILQAAAPAVLFTALTAAYRGYAQGKQAVFPYAAAQVCEQAVKLAAGIWLAAKWMERGEGWGAVGAMTGVSISELCGLLVMGLWTGKVRGRPEKGMFARYIAQLTKLSLPVTMGMAVLPILGSIDGVLCIRLLQRYAEGDSTALYGLYSGFVMPVMHLPGVIASAVSVCALPAVASAVAEGRQERLHNRLSISIRVICMAGLPLVIGMWLLAEPLLAALYRGLSAQELQTGEYLMRLAAPGVFLAMLAQVSGTLLQGLGRMSRPAVNMAVGAACRLLTEWLLIPRMGIGGAAIGGVVCFAVPAALNMWAVKRRGNGSYPLSKCLLQPLLAGIWMAGGMAAVWQLMGSGGVWGMLCAGVAGTGIYVGSLWLMHALPLREI